LAADETQIHTDKKEDVFIAGLDSGQRGALTDAERVAPSIIQLN